MAEEEREPITPSDDSNAIPTYEKFSEIHPPRISATDEDGGDGNGLEEHAGSLKSRTQVAPKLSDFQIVDKRLFPILRAGCDYLNNLMVDRIMPEEIIPYRSMLTKHLLSEFDDISYTEAFSIADIAVKVGLDSEGRIDIARVFVKAGEMEEDKEKAKN